jgi:hypothetical protein
MTKVFPSFRLRGAALAAAGISLCILSHGLHAASHLLHEEKFVLSHSSGVLGFSWNGKKLVRTVSKPASAKIDGDAAMVHYLTGNSISRGEPDGGRRTIWTAPGPVTDLFLVGSELWVLRPDAPITRLDRFDGNVLGEIAVDFDAADFMWSRHAGSRQLTGLRRTAAGYEVVLVAPTGDAASIRRFETAAARADAASIPLQPCRGETTAWFPDGTLRALADGEILHDAGSAITAACSITADLHAIASGGTVKIIDTDGLTLVELKTSGPTAALGYRDRMLWITTTTGKAQVALLADVPTGIRPAVFPPAAGLHQPSGFQMLPDGRILMGDDAQATGHLFSTERGDFVSGIPLPKPGAVQAFPELSRIGFAPTGQSPRTPWFADFTRFPAWTAAPQASMQNALVRSRTATDRSWIFDYSNNGRQVTVVHDVTTGNPTTAPSNTLRFDPAGAWQDADETLFSFQGARTVQHHHYQGASLAWTGDSFQPFVRDSEPDWLRVDPAGQAMATPSSLWLRNPTRHVTSFDRPVDDAAWLDQILYTVRRTANHQTVVEERRGPHYLPGRTRTLAGSPAALRAHQGKLHVALRSPRMELSFVTLDGELQPATPAIQRAAIPAALTVEKRDVGSITLGWDALPPGTAAALRVEYRAQAKKPKPWTVRLILPADATTARVDGLPAGKPCEFRLVVANGDAVESTPVLSATPRNGKDAIDGSPYDLTARLTPGIGTEISWSDRMSDETGFLLKRYDMNSSRVETFELPADTTTYTDLTAANGETYYYTITPRRGDTTGEESPGASIRVLKLDSGFASSSLRADIVTLGVVVLRWENEFGNHVRYRILQRRLQNSQAWQRVAVLEPDATSYIDLKAPQGRRYEYRLVEGSAEGERGPLNSLVVDHPGFNGGGRDGGTRWDDILYLLVPHDGRVRRFDVISGTWLADLQPRVPEAIQHFHVSDLGIFFSSASTIYRIPLEGGETETVFSGSGVECFWTSGVRLHVATFNGIRSLALAGPDVGQPETRSLVAAVPSSVHLGPDRSRVYGCSDGGGFGGGFVTLMEETEPGKFVTRNYRGPAQPGSPSRVHFLSAADSLIDSNGNTYRSDDLLPTGRPSLGWSLMDETPSGYTLLLQSGSLYCYDEFFDSQGSINPLFGAAAFAHHDDRAWFFRFDASTPEFWLVREESAAPLGLPVIDPNDPDPYFGTPRAHGVDSQGRHWSIHSQQRHLVLRSPGIAGTGARLDLGGIFLTQAFDPATDLLAVLIRNALGLPEMRVFDLTHPEQAPSAFAVPRSSHSLAWIGGRLVVDGSQDGAVYLSDGTQVETLPGETERSRTLDVQAAGVTVSLNSSGESATLIWRSGMDERVFTFPATVGLDEAILVASADEDRLFTWPGGLRPLSDPATSIPINCFQPVAAAWAGDRLLVIDRQVPGSAWLTAYDSRTGHEIDRRPVEDTTLLLAMPGGQVDLVGLDPARRLKFTRFNSALDLVAHGSGRAPSLLPHPTALTWIAGAEARLQTRVDGDGPMSYEWLKDGEILPGRTTSRLEFPSTSEADSGTYRLRVTSAHGSALSAELRLTVLPPVDWSGRRGNLLELTSAEFREHRPNGDLVGKIAMPETIYATYSTAFNLDDSGRIHLAAYSDIRKRHMLFTWQAARGWSAIELPKDVATYNGTAESRGNVVRFFDLSYDFGDACFRRTHSTLQRPWGDLFQSSAGLEDIRGRLVRPEKPDLQLLPNGWKVGSTWVANGFFHILNTLDGRSRMFRPSPNGVGSSTNSVYQLEQIQDNELIMGTTTFNFDTLELGKLPVTLSYNSRVRVIGGNRGLQVKTSAYNTPEIERYYSALPYFYQWFIPGLGDVIPFGGSTPWITPHTPVGNGRYTAWELSFLPFGHTTWKGLPVRWQTPIPEGDSFVHAFAIMLDPATGRPYSKIEFSHDLKNWSQQVPEGAELDMGGEQLPPSIRLTPSAAGEKSVFFRFVTPPNPFPVSP